MDIAREEFMKKYRISPGQFADSQLSWDELREIAEDYERRQPELDRIRNEFIREYFLDREEVMGLQSYRSRCKAAEHVVEKIVRKRIENYVKYKDLSKDNYWMFLTDLIGIRGLLLYREDWVRFHTYITGRIQNAPERYVKGDSVHDYVNDGSVFMAEPPKVHIRAGDFHEIYADWIPLEHILDRKHYRSVHYIVNCRGTYIEIQIRTLFEEGWGEIDHDILYPCQKDNPMLLEFSELLNRLSGMGDEMGSYYHRLQAVPEQSFRGKRAAVSKPQAGQLHFSNHGSLASVGNVRTFQDAIDSVVRE